MLEIITKEKMDSIKALADMSVKISDAKATLANLENTETEYLTKREKKAQVQIEKILKDSENLLNKTHKNYEEINTFCNVVSSYVDVLDKVYEKFQKMLTDFNKRNEMWDKKIETQTLKFSALEKQLKQDSETIKIREARIDETNENIKKEKELIESRQSALAISYKQEKDLWEKLQKQS